MFDDDDHITISYCHEGESWFEMDLYLPMLVTCPKNKMPKILNQFIKDEKCEEKAKKLLNFWEQQRDKYECNSGVCKHLNRGFRTANRCQHHKAPCRHTPDESRIAGCKKATCRQESTQKTHLRYLEIQL